jgi:hypothetical protein
MITREQFRQTEGHFLTMGRGSGNQEPQPPTAKFEVLPERSGVVVERHTNLREAWFVDYQITADASEHHNSTYLHVAHGRG